MVTIWWNWRLRYRDHRLSYASASIYTCGGTQTTAGSNTLCTFTSDGTFTVGTSTTAMTTSTTKLQDLNYTYDADGNILTRTDNSSSGGGQKVSYTYDTLNRLLTASTTLSNQTHIYKPSPTTRSEISRAVHWAHIHIKAIPAQATPIPMRSRKY